MLQTFRNNDYSSLLLLIKNSKDKRNETRFFSVLKTFDLFSSKEIYTTSLRLLFLWDTILWLLKSETWHCNSTSLFQTAEDIFIRMIAKSLTKGNALKC